MNQDKIQIKNFPNFMKKIIGVIAACFALSIGLIFLVSRGGSDRRIAVVPNGREIPSWKPLEFHINQATIEKMGYRPVWLDLKGFPKKHDYLRRFFNFISNKYRAKAFIFNNYYPFFSKAKIAQLPKGNRILIMWEPPSVLVEMYQEDVLSLFDKIYTWNDDLVDGKKFFKIQYKALRPMKESLVSFKDRKLLCMIASNYQFNQFKDELYSTRRAIVHELDQYPDETFDLYGKLWKDVAHARGTIPSKLEVLEQYKFNICFENTKQPGYITEKIFDCFATGTIPIYYGATNIDEYIPNTCYIDYRQFTSVGDMVSYIEAISEEEYESYLKNIRAYLQSDQAQLFSKDHFSKTLIRAIEAKQVGVEKDH
jgi:hypothetical protein